MISSRWLAEPHTDHAAFRDWTVRYESTAPADRAVLIDEGVRLAAARRSALRELIRTDPEAALAAAVPMAVRSRLPATVVAQLETRISAQGSLSLNAVTLRWCRKTGQEGSLNPNPKNDPKHVQ